ncbi:uncharacterized protein LOC115290093 isoform X2 [Suricata suricatta]|uniref:uncharacterized protein LOC115290093 isoform X2 n=1 Tax=Suricata suricatta TaxID=37032 RepID=UPI001155A4F4|nr:uncharacterized protein LOC115290093 isoform X2 [Suricata suricatta]XP_029793684.1 uncharacterized protein LOC115290093 isoform X2 [Suricata suricatta]
MSRQRIPSSRASWKLTFSSKCLIKYLQPQNEEGPRGLQSPQPHEARTEPDFCPGRSPGETCSQCQRREGHAACSLPCPLESPVGLPVSSPPHAKDPQQSTPPQSFPLWPLDGVGPMAPAGHSHPCTRLSPAFSFTQYLLSVVSGCLATCTIGSTSSWPCSYIASDMEEDNPTSKQSIFQFLLGREHWPDLYKEFLKLKVEFFRAMGHRAWVTPELCEEIQAQNPHHWVWSREHQCAP